MPNALYAQEDTYERAGLFLVNKDGKYIVLDARPGTAAAQAGLAKGDTIDTIDGKPASAMSLQSVRALFFGTAGTVLKIGVIGANGAHRDVVLTLHDFV
jgi:C-terminal processing protease CtpA/Prc